MGLINLIIDQILYLWKNSRNSDWNEFYELCRDVIGKDRKLFAFPPF